jgi:AcrR family transcriptional regulator
MPKVVDHIERREELLEAVWRVLARDGLAGATIRAIAQETGWSAGVLAHYFTDKEDILISALRLSHERIVDRWEEKLADLEGLAALRELVLDNLPLDDERELETKLQLIYWDRAVASDAVRLARWRRGPLLVDRLATLVAEAQERGEISTQETSVDLAERLHAVIDGLSLHALLDPKRLTRARLAALIEQEFARITTPTEVITDVESDGTNA